MGEIDFSSLDPGAAERLDWRKISAKVEVKPESWLPTEQAIGRALNPEAMMAQPPIAQAGGDSSTGKPIEWTSSEVAMSEPQSPTFNYPPTPEFVLHRITGHYYKNKVIRFRALSDNFDLVRIITIEEAIAHHRHLVKAYIGSQPTCALNTMVSRHPIALRMLRRD